MHNNLRLQVHSPTVHKNTKGVTAADGNTLKQGNGCFTSWAYKIILKMNKGNPSGKHGTLSDNNRMYFKLLIGVSVYYQRSPNQEVLNYFSL